MRTDEMFDHWRWDVWPEFRDNARYSIATRLCTLLGHAWAYEGPSPWEWSGEGFSYCVRCCYDRSDFFEAVSWTWGDWFWKEALPGFFQTWILP